MSVNSCNRIEKSQTSRNNKLELLSEPSLGAKGNPVSKGFDFSCRFQN